MKKNTCTFISTALALPLIVLTAAACGSTGRTDTGSEGTMRTIEKRLKGLEDREGIRRLLMDYGRFLDRRDFKSFADLFAENEGEWIGGMGKARGRQAILRLMEEKIGNRSGDAAPDNFHLFANERIDLDGDSATAETKWVFIVKNATGRPEPFYLGHYEDRLVREEGSWKFLRRVVYSDIPADSPESDGTD